MRNVTKLLLLACTALITVFTSCQAIAANSGQSLSSDTVWIRLIPGAPFEDGNGLRTAELTLDFSKAIAGLETGIDEAELAEIFTFELVDAEGTVKSAEMKATAVRKYAEAFYLLTVGNIPADGGIAKLTVKRSGIAPPFRLWALDGGEADEFVSLDPNGGIYDGGAPAECKIFALGEGFTLPDPSGSGFDWSDALPLIPKPSHPARAFIDWTTEADGGGTSYSAGAAITEALTLYAQWTPVWTVSFALNGGAGDIPAAETVVAGALAEFSLPDDSGITAPNEHWLAFLGWDSRADGNGTNYNAGANYTPDA
ncbi:MAG: InlB B-repeat-containing protein, partial [Spirochaetaceae bacterium]|nr:InlB B-repeat-containing protein [Spirochaetaceae bacterium]